MAETDRGFDELAFFARVKKRPGMFLGKPSLVSLRDMLGGMRYAFSCCHQKDSLKYFDQFIAWYHREKLKDRNGYACWWNHILYTSGNNDVYAFESFFRYFEQYLREAHDLCLPQVE